MLNARSRIQARPEDAVPWFRCKTAVTGDLAKILDCLYEGYGKG